MPLRACDLGNMVTKLENLNTFDISHTYNLEMKRVEQAFLMFRGKPVTTIKLSKFQTAGNTRLTTAFNVSRLLSDNGTVLEHLAVLDISFCAITYIHVGFYNVFPNLRMLDVSGNDLTYMSNFPVLLEVLVHPAITKLRGVQLGCNKPTQEGNIQTQSQLLQGRNSKKPCPNPMHTGNKRIVAHIEDFFLDCINNNSKENISNLFLNHSDFRKTLKCIFPEFLGHLNNSLFPPLHKVFDFESVFMMRLPVGPNLQVIETSVSSAAVSTVHRNFRNISFNIKTVKNNITNIYISMEIKSFLPNSKGNDNNFYYIIQGLNKVSHLSFHSAGALSMEDLMKHVVPNVQYLNISGLTACMPESFGFCKDTSTFIKVVDISNGHLTTLPPNLITNCTLLRKILIFNNNIEYLFLNLNGTDNLQLIDLRNNKIQRIAGLLQPHLNNILTAETFQIDLHDNPLPCACDKDSKTFLEWSKHTVLSLYEKESLTCYGRQGNSFLSHIVDDMGLYYQACFPSHFTVIVVTIATTLSVLFSIVLVIFVYHKRWKIRYIMFSIQQRLSRKSITEGATSERNSFQYDAFVSYCSEDRFWVHGILMTMLENFYKFHLCIHYRDFPLGEFISDAIIQKVEESRELILVISDQYLHPSREWCRFETEVLRLCSLRRNKPLIVITLGNITRENLDLNITNLLDTQVVLPWPEDEGGHPLFWAKLVNEMYNDGRSWCCVRMDNVRDIGPEVINKFANDSVDSERVPLIRHT